MLSYLGVDIEQDWTQGEGTHFQWLGTLVGHNSGWGTILVLHEYHLLLREQPHHRLEGELHHRYLQIKWLSLRSDII